MTPMPMPRRRMFVLLHDGPRLYVQIDGQEVHVNLPDGFYWHPTVMTADGAVYASTGYYSNGHSYWLPVTREDLLRPDAAQYIEQQLRVMSLAGVLNGGGS